MYRFFPWCLFSLFAIPGERERAKSMVPATTIILMCVCLGFFFFLFPVEYETMCYVRRPGGPDLFYISASCRHRRDAIN